MNGGGRLHGVIDGHNDLPWALRASGMFALDGVDLLSLPAGFHTDLERLRLGEVTGQFWAAYVPSTLSGPDAVVQTLEQIDLIHRMIGRHSDRLGAALTADDVQRVAESGRIASLIGVEGGHSIAESLGTLRMLHALGVRYMTLTHNDNNTWADSATDTPVHNGLSAFGETVVAEMNRIGMMVDLSHVSADVMRHAIRVSTAPVIFSHSSARAVCDVPRNVPDDVLTSLAGNGGVCMITFVAGFVSPNVAEWVKQCSAWITEQGGHPRNYAENIPLIKRYRETHPTVEATMDELVAHIEHVREVAGLDHVGIGGDYDGCDQLPVGLGDVTGYPRLWDSLRQKGWSEDDLDQLRYGNVLRVLGDVERVAEASATAAKQV